MRNFDFDKEFDRTRRQGNLIRRIALGWTFIVFLLMLAAIGSAIYWGATTTPEDIGSFAGRIISGFRTANQEPPHAD